MGGGFENGTEVGGFMAETSSSGQKGAKKYGEKPLLPATVKQLRNADSADGGDLVKIDGVSPAFVKIMGTIESIERHATVITYMINDTTETIKCIFYLEKEDGESSQRFEECRENSFVRVVGLCRSPGVDVNVLIFSMTLVTDFNEVTHHILETIYCHNFAIKGPLSSAAVSASNCKNFYMHFVSHSLTDSPSIASHNNPPSDNFGMGTMGAGRVAPFTPGMGNQHQIQSGGGNSSSKDMVLDAIKKTTIGDSGTTKDSVFQFISKIGAPISMNEISKVVQLMTDEGLVYSTIDEDHFMCTE